MSFWDNASDEDLRRWGMDDDKGHFYSARKPIKSKESELLEENQKLKEEIKRLKKKLGE